MGKRPEASLLELPSLLTWASGQSWASRGCIALEQRELAGLARAAIASQLANGEEWDLNRELYPTMLTITAVARNRLTAYPDRGCAQVNVAPLQGQQFALPNAGVEGEPERRRVFRSDRRRIAAGEQPRQLGVGEIRGLPAPAFRPLLFRDPLNRIRACVAGDNRPTQGWTRAPGGVSPQSSSRP